MEKKARMSFTKKEIILMHHVLNRTLEMLAGDDRPDHGLALLKRSYKEEDIRSKWYNLMGRFWRAR